MKAGPSVPDEILAKLCAKHTVRIAAGKEAEHPDDVGLGDGEQAPGA